MMNATIARLPEETGNSKEVSAPPPPEEAGREDQQPCDASSSSHLTQNATDAQLNPRSVATLSQAWEYNDVFENCCGCSVRFTLLERKHHCRYCGKIFCHNCTRDKALIPPSAIVLVPRGGKQVTSLQAQQHQQMAVSFSPQDDPDRMLTYVASGTGNSSPTGSTGEVLLYGKGLEERFQLAREPLRVCRQCNITLQPIQVELQQSNSHAMRFNHIDPTDVRRLFNSPIAFTLGHEVRKAAYTLNNLLPQPKGRLGATMGFADNFNYTGTPGIHQQCTEECQTMTPNMAQLDGLRIPARLLQEAKGIAVLTVVKGGFGMAGCEFGTGLVVARLGGNSSTWSAPSAIGTAGLSWGALLGAQISDHVFVCMTEEAVEMLMSSNGSVQLGADIGVAVGPVGRSLEADYGASHGGHVAPIYTYSLSKGLYAGLSLDGKVIVTRHNVNEKFYGRKVSPEEILQGLIPTPPAAQPLYDALTRCQVYTHPNFHASRRPTDFQYSGRGESMEYGEWQPEMMSGMHSMTLDSSTASVPYNMQPQQQPMPMTILEEQPFLHPQQPFVHQQQEFPTMQPPSVPIPQQQAPTAAFQPTIAQLPPSPTEQYPMPPASNDQHSYAGLSDITYDPGY